MTIQKLHPEIIQRKKHDHHKSQVAPVATGGSRAVVAVDVSGRIVKAIKTIDAARSFHVWPKIPMKEALQQRPTRQRLATDTPSTCSQPVVVRGIKN